MCWRAAARTARQSGSSDWLGSQELVRAGPGRFLAGVSVVYGPAMATGPGLTTLRRTAARRRVVAGGSAGLDPLELIEGQLLAAGGFLARHPRHDLRIRLLVVSMGMGRCFPAVRVDELPDI